MRIAFSKHMNLYMNLSAKAKKAFTTCCAKQALLKSPWRSCCQSKREAQLQVAAPIKCYHLLVFKQTWMGSYRCHTSDQTCSIMHNDCQHGATHCIKHA